MYITFEGIDGSGKTTQIDLFYAWLKDKMNVELIKQPLETTECGKTLRQYLKRGYKGMYDRYVFALLFAANRAEINDVMTREPNKLYLTDRSLYSNYVYSNLNEEWFNKIERYSPKPDLVYLFDIDPEIAFKRCNSGEAYESLHKLEDARELYLRLAHKYNHNWVIIDVGDKSIDALQRELQTHFMYGVMEAEFENKNFKR